jgi:parvulin-like peptidyl-prolyl isomerase
MPLSPIGIIDRSFGEDFGRKLMKVPKGEWSGPLESPFGLHLVRITDRRSGYDPPLEQVRKAVELKWRTEKRDAFVQAEYKRLREKYEVVLPAADTPAEAAKPNAK